jgi:hypothetical protein
MTNTDTFTEITVVYEECIEFLAVLAVRLFALDERTAGELAYDVCLNSLRRIGEVDDMRVWLVAAMLHASQTTVSDPRRMAVRVRNGSMKSYSIETPVIRLGLLHV